MKRINDNKATQKIEEKNKKSQLNECFFNFQKKETVKVFVKKTGHMY